MNKHRPLFAVSDSANFTRMEFPMAEFKTAPLPAHHTVVGRLVNRCTSSSWCAKVLRCQIAHPFHLIRVCTDFVCRSFMSSLLAAWCGISYQSVQMLRLSWCHDQLLRN